MGKFAINHDGSAKLLAFLLAEVGVQNGTIDYRIMMCPTDQFSNFSRIDKSTKAIHARDGRLHEPAALLALSTRDAALCDSPQELLATMARPGAISLCLTHSFAEKPRATLLFLPRLVAAYQSLASGVMELDTEGGEALTEAKAQVH